MIGALTSDPTFSDPVLEPEVVSDAIVAAILSGRSSHIVLPKAYTTVTGIRAWPVWMQQIVRNHLGSLMDVRVRYGGKYTHDPRLDGGTIEGMNP